MASILQFGDRQLLELDLDSTRLRAEAEGGAGLPLHDPAAAAARALAEPIDYPPFAKAVVAGDRVALAVGRDVPRQSAIVAGVVVSALESGIRPEDLTVVHARDESTDGATDLLRDLPARIADQVGSIRHDPSDRSRLSYLAASSEGRPIYLNRQLFDADVVLPIGCLRTTPSVDDHGAYSGLFPAFSDRETIERFRTPSHMRSETGRQRQRKEVDEAGWLSGAAMAMGIVPGSDGQVLRVLAGAAGSVRHVGQALCDSAWRISVSRPANLVIATVGGDRGQQTWENVARAIDAATRVVTEGGAVVVWTQIDAHPGPPLLGLSNWDDLDRALAHVEQEGSPNAWPASVLIRALAKARVYLFSPLEEELVERMRMVPVAAVEEIYRLARSHDTWALLASTQHARPQVVAP